MSRPTRSNKAVIGAWIAGDQWKNGSGSLHTDGKVLVSYNLVIGERFEDGLLVAYKPEACSPTTRQHSALSIAVADSVQPNTKS
jgi:hypothetical protein